jgi:hypothetical protein
MPAISAGIHAEDEKAAGKLSYQKAFEEFVNSIAQWARVDNSEKQESHLQQTKAAKSNPAPGYHCGNTDSVGAPDAVGPPVDDRRAALIGNL